MRNAECQCQPRSATDLPLPFRIPHSASHIALGVAVRLAPEGWPFILPGWALVLLGAWVARGSPWVWIPEGALFLIAVWLLVFFRDPVRAGPRGEQYVIAPADGKIVDVRVVDEPQYLKAQATRISIFMSVFDVHVNRYPATGTVELVRYNS